MEKIMETISIKEYLNRKGIPFRESNGELITRCIFNNCDADSKVKEAHLYFNAATSQYECKKCGETGNIHTLAKHLGDSAKDIALEPLPPRIYKKKSDDPKFTADLVENCHITLPNRVREYLNARGINDSLIDEYKLGWGQFYGQSWITIPIKNQNGEYYFFKLRQDPQEGSDKTTYPRGIESQIYDWQILKSPLEKVVICEGEMDRLLLVSKGIPAITSTHGAGTFKDEWLDALKEVKQVYVCFDNDDAGHKGAEKLMRKLLDSKRHQVFVVTLPQELGDGGDITDYFIKHNGSEGDLFGKLAKECLSLEQTPRIRKVEKPEKLVSFEEWRATIKENFPDLLLAAEIGISTIAQLLIKDITNPCAVVLVDVPAAGKTIAINFFSEIDGLTYATDKFTPAAFVSNAANIKKEKLKEVDLLPRLQYKMFLVRDMATIFSKRDDDLAESMGLLTRLLDGEGLNTESGVHGERHYVGEYLFMMFAASTPLPPKVWKLMGNLGSRLFFYNTNAKVKEEDELVQQVLGSTHKQKEMICRDVTERFLQTLWYQFQSGIEWDRATDNEGAVRIITRCAVLLSRLRGVVNVWKERSDDGTEYVNTHPIVEMPNRINQLFYNLARGHALAAGRTKINFDDLKPVIEIAFDSTTSGRSILFRNLLERDGTMSTNEVEKVLDQSKPTALKEMKMLELLGVCYSTGESHGLVGEPEKEIHLVQNLRWFLSDECKKIRGIPLPPKQEPLLGGDG